MDRDYQTFEEWQFILGMFRWYEWGVLVVNLGAHRPLVIDTEQLLSRRKATMTVKDGQ